MASLCSEVLCASCIKSYKNLGFEVWEAVAGHPGEPTSGTVIFPFLASFPICQINDLLSLF